MFQEFCGGLSACVPLFLFCKFCENSEEPLCGNEMKRNAKQKWREFPWEQILEYWLGGCDDDDDNGDDNDDDKNYGDGILLNIVLNTLIMMTRMLMTIMIKAKIESNFFNTLLHPPIFPQS